MSSEHTNGRKPLTFDDLPNLTLSEDEFEILRLSHTQKFIMPPATETKNHCERLEKLGLLTIDRYEHNNRTFGNCNPTKLGIKFLEIAEKRRIEARKSMKIDNSFGSSADALAYAHKQFASGNQPMLKIVEFMFSEINALNKKLDDFFAQVGYSETPDAVEVKTEQPAVKDAKDKS